MAVSVLDRGRGLWLTIAFATSSVIEVLEDCVNGPTVDFFVAPRAGKAHRGGARRAESG